MPATSVAYAVVAPLDRDDLGFVAPPRGSILVIALLVLLLPTLLLPMPANPRPVDRNLLLELDANATPPSVGMNPSSTLNQIAETLIIVMLLLNMTLSSVVAATMNRLTRRK